MIASQMLSARALAARLLLGSGLVLTTAAAHAAQLQILNEGLQPLADAEVLIGEAPGVPFEGNVLKTNAQGEITIPAGWQAALPVTITASGYIPATFNALAPIDNSLQLSRVESRTAIEVRGETKSFGDLKKDGKVNFALVYPGLNSRQLNRFDIDSMINSDTDKIKIITEELSIPSNLTLPEQKENYILPITLNKPIYRMSFKQEGDYRMFALHGQFPLKQVVDEIRGGKSIYDVINRFTMLTGGQRDVNANKSLTGQDIQVNQMEMKKKISVKAPALADGELMFSFPLLKQGPLYFPTDLKRVLTNESLDLLVPSNSTENSLISMLATKDSFDFDVKIEELPFESSLHPEIALDQFVSSLMTFMTTPSDELLSVTKKAATAGISTARHADGEATPRFLALIPQPVRAAGRLDLKPPKAMEGIEPTATYAILSESETKNGVTRRYRIAEVAQLGWATSLTLPKSLETLPPGKKYRWEVLFLGQRSGHTGDSEYFLDSATHISRNSLDF